MSAALYAADHRGPGGFEAGSIERAVTEHCAAETLRAVEAFDAWRQAAPAGMRCMHVSSTADSGARAVVAIAYSLNSHGTPKGVEHRGYGRDWIGAIEDLARNGAKWGAW